MGVNLCSNQAFDLEIDFIFGAFHRVKKNLVLIWTIKRGILGLRRVLLGFVVWGRLVYISQFTFSNSLPPSLLKHIYCRVTNKRIPCLGTSQAASAWPLSRPSCCSTTWNGEPLPTKRDSCIPTGPGHWFAARILWWICKHTIVSIARIRWWICKHTIVSIARIRWWICKHLCKNTVVNVWAFVAIRSNSATNLTLKKEAFAARIPSCVSIRSGICKYLCKNTVVNVWTGQANLSISI